MRNDKERAGFLLTGVLTCWLLLLPCLMGLSASYGQTDSIQRRDTLQEVVVTSHAATQRLDELQIGVERISMEAVGRLPSFFGERDVLKSMQLLPGVKSEGDGVGGYEVRGGTSSQNLILMDGAAVYNASHLMGLFSAFNDDAIGSVELFKGLMPSRYGGGSSSVLNLNQRIGDTDSHHYGVTVGLLSAKAVADGPMGAKGSSYLVAGRTSYLNLFIKGMPDYDKNSLSFYDLNVRLNFRLGDSDQLGVSAFRGYDMIDVEKMLTMSWSNTTGALSWLHRWNASHYALTQLVASDYNTSHSIEVYTINYSMKGFNRQLTLRHQQTWTSLAHHTISAGAESTLLGLQSASWRIGSYRECEKRDAWLAALWLSDDVSLLNNRLSLSAGLRLDCFSALGGAPYYQLDQQGNITETQHPKSGKLVKTYAHVQPRLSINWQPIPPRKDGSMAMTVRAGYTRVTQPIQPIRNSSMSMPFDRLTMASNNIKPQVADQMAAGIAVMTRGGGYDFSADVYWKKLQNVYDYREGKTFNSEIEIERLLAGGHGRAWGLELAAHKNKGALTGWVAYTLSRTENKIEGIMDNKWYTAPNDRRHDLAVVGMYQLTDKWQLSAVWRYTTGQAMTAPSAKYEMDGDTYYYFGRRNEERAPDYHRLDLSASHTRQLRRSTHTWTFGLFNAYNRYNPFFVHFEEDKDNATATKAIVTSLFGIVPSVALTIRF
ncbi:MAG: TonB-dependent receptor [Prevotella sp.]|nr:TonB-dependent receptor [Prevotella sp.]